MEKNPLASLKEGFKIPVIFMQIKTTKVKRLDFHHKLGQDQTVNQELSTLFQFTGWTSKKCAMPDHTCELRGSNNFLSHALC